MGVQYDCAAGDGEDVQIELESPSGKAPVMNRKRRAKGMSVRPRERAK